MNTKGYIVGNPELCNQVKHDFLQELLNRGNIAIRTEPINIIEYVRDEKGNDRLLQTTVPDVDHIWAIFFTPISTN